MSQFDSFLLLVVDKLLTYLNKKPGCYTHKIKVSARTVPFSEVKPVYLTQEGRMFYYE